MNRRSVLSGCALAATAGLSVNRSWPVRSPIRRPSRPQVEVLQCNRYDDAPRVIDEGLRRLAPEVRGKAVVLKPNLVEYSATAPINTHPVVVAGAVEALYRLGAATVTVAEGPGHVRDTHQLLDECGLAEQLKAVGRTRFVDLNFDEVSRVSLNADLTSLRELWLPDTVLAADVLISMPKVKTHHWAGVTLSLKNLFGIVPGSVYGWPKNVLHWEGIDRSILEIASAVPIHYVIADAVVAMEGNGPLHGTSRQVGRLIVGNDPIIVDEICSSLIGISPNTVRHLRLARALEARHG